MMFAIPVTQLHRQVPLFVCQYLLAEAAGLLVAVLSITLAARLTDNSLIWIAASVYSSSVGYYAVLAVCIWCFGQGDRVLTEPNRRRRLMHTMRTLVLEFGSAELLDSLLFSPWLLYLSLRLLANPQLALVLSELLSTGAFYITLLIVKSWQTKVANSKKETTYAIPRTSHATAFYKAT
ncbi:MAG: hypothetical protein U0175_18725 [Caldilineaceae bacterium]